MKTLRNILTAGLALLAAIACKPEDPAAEPASISITLESVTTESISFKLAPENAVSYAYACVPAAEASTASFISVEGGGWNHYDRDEDDCYLQHTAEGVEILLLRRAPLALEALERVDERYAEAHGHEHHIEGCGARENLRHGTVGGEHVGQKHPHEESGHYM